MIEKVCNLTSHCPSVCFGTRKEEKPMRVEKKNFIFTNHVFLFLLFGPLLLSKLITFSFLNHLK
jgi:hypothetical protein